MIDFVFEIVTRVAAAWIAWMQSRYTAKNHQDFMVESIKYENGKAEFSIADCPAVKVIAIEASMLLTEHDAENFVMVDVSPKCYILDPIRITVQWAIGKSPARVIAEVKKENARLLAELESANGRLMNALRGEK